MNAVSATLAVTFAFFGTGTALAADAADNRAASDTENLTVLESGTRDVKPSQMLYRHLQQQAHSALDKRRKTYESLDNPEDIRRYQQRLREFFVKQLGGFPERTPLSAKTVGRLTGDGYRVEKVIFESRPRHHVTALLYLPNTKPPFPGVVVASGHSRTGKAAGYNQRFGIIMAKHGMAALCYDPIGQGERSQILTDEGKPKHRGTTTEHFLIGVGAILVGRNTANYRIWDGMRAIDYLTSREEIDPKRIGFTGCSGGGTLTSYVMALDDRVACAAPACYLTTFRRLIDTIGPQDAEQNIFGQIAFGMDQPDYVLMRAPKPTLISATTKDFFDITGTWENFRQAKRIYTRLGHPERVNLVEGPGGHGVPMTNLNAIARWMSRWLLDKDEPISETDISVRPMDELRCTPKGQVLLLPDERSVFDLNAEYERQLAKHRADWRRTTSPSERRNKVRQLAGIQPLDKLPKPEATKVGTVQRNGYTIEKLLLQPKGRLPLPALRFEPKKSTGPVYLYLHGEGKAADAAPGGPMESLVKQGHIVLAVDLSGLGETRRSGSGGMLGDWKNYYMAYLLGKSLVGMRAEDTLIAARFLSEQRNPTNGKARRVHLIAVGETAIPALHAAAVHPALIGNAQLKRTIRSWRDVVSASETQNQLTGTVHGALRFYDLPNLVELVGNKRVTIEEPVTVGGTP